MTSPYLMGGKHASFHSVFFCSDSNKHLILNCRGNGSAAKLCLEQQAEDKSAAHAAKGGLGRYRDKAESCVRLWFCLRIKCKMESIVPTVELLQSTMSEIKGTLTPPWHSEAVLLRRIGLRYLLITSVGFQNQCGQRRVESQRWTWGPSLQQSPFAFLPLPRPSSWPPLPAPTRAIAFLFRYSLVLFISISPQRAVVYLLVPALRFLPFRANLWLILSASPGGLYNPADPKSLSLEPPKLSTSCLFGCLFGLGEGVSPLQPKPHWVGVGDGVDGYSTDRDRDQEEG